MAENTEQGNAQKAFNFLKSFRPNGLINVTAIHPSGDVNGITARSDDIIIKKFIELNEGKSNLYFMVNEPHKNNLKKQGKLKKEDVNKIHALWIDADPDKTKPPEDEKQRLAIFSDQLFKEDNPPTYIIHSGNGVQAFWVFEKPIDATTSNVEHCEALSRGLSVKYNTDFVQNIERIMRIPYTTNIPDARKLKLGRTKSLAKITHATSQHGTRYNKIDFIEPSYAADKDNDIDDYDMSKLKDELPPDLNSKLNDHLNTHKKLDKLWNGTFMVNSDRSAWDYAIASELKQLGYTLDECAQLLYLYPFGKGKEQTPREIARCFGRTANEFEPLPQDYIDKINAQTNPNETLADAIITPKSKTKRLKAINAFDAEWKNNSKPLVKGLIDQNTVTVLYGQSNTGKSFVATDIAGHVASAKNWGVHKVPSKMGVLYICAEAGMSYSRRLAALKRRLSVDNKTGLKNFPYQYVAMGVNFLTSNDDIKDVVILARQQEEETGIKVGLIVIDTLATTFSGGNENSSEDMGKYIEHMKFIQEHAQSSVLVVHHSGKDVAAGARGHSSLRAATDTELEVISEKRGEKYSRCIRTKKQRDGESDTNISFNLKVVELGRDDDNDPITTCHVVLPNDNEFEDLSPSKTDGLSLKEKSAFQAVNLYDLNDPNPDTYGLTKKQIMTKLYMDILNENDVLVPISGDDVGVFVVSNLQIIGKPTEGEMKAFSRQLDNLVSKDVIEKIVFL